MAKMSNLGDYLRKILKSTSVKNAFVLAFVNGIIGVFSILTQVLIANTLGKEQFGTYCYYIAIGNIGATVVRYGRDRTMVRDLVQKSDQFSRIVGSSIVLSIMLTICFFIGLVVYTKTQSEHLPIAFWLVVIGLIGISYDLQPVYDSWGRISRHSVYYFLQKMLGFVPIWIVIFCYPRFFSINFAAWFILLGVVVSLGLQYFDVHRKKHFQLFSMNNVYGAIQQFKESSYIAIATILGLSLGPIIQIFIKFYCNEIEVGIYGAGWQIFVITMFATFQICRVGNPIMSRINQPSVSIKEKRITILKYSLLIIACSMFFAVPGLIAPEYTVRVLYKPEFSKVASILPCFSIYCIIFSLGIVFSQYIQAVRLDHLYFLIIILGFMLIVIFSWLLIPSYGAKGASIVLLISHGTTMILHGIIVFSHLFFIKYNKGNV